MSCLLVWWAVGPLDASKCVHTTWYTICVTYDTHSTSTPVVGRAASHFIFIFPEQPRPSVRRQPRIVRRATGSPCVLSSHSLLRCRRLRVLVPRRSARGPGPVHPRPALRATDATLTLTLRPSPFSPPPFAVTLTCLSAARFSLADACRCSAHQASTAAFSASAHSRTCSRKHPTSQITGRTER